MKTRILTGLCIAFMAAFISVRAEDNHDQAAARAALEQKMYELNHPGTQPSADTNSATTTVVQPVEPVTNATGTASAPAVSPRAAPAKTISEPALAAEVPAKFTPAKAAPALTAPAGSDFDAKIPPNNASAQAAALTALNQKMEELNQPEARTAPETNSAPEMATAPITETPAAEVPVAKTPAMAPAAVAPISTAPAVVVPAPKVATAPAAAASTVAVAPAAVPGPAAAPARISPAAMLPFPFSSPRLARPTNELVTNSGKTYRNVEVQRVVSDGIFISYIPVHGGWAMTKVPFKDLPPEIRKQYEKK